MEVEEIINVEVPVKPQNNGGSDLQKYYGYLKSKGADVPPTFDSFQKTLQDEQSARKYYDYVKKSGYDAPPTYESFANTLGLKKKETTTPQVSTKDLGTTVSPLKNGGQSVPDGNSPKQPNFSPVGQLLGGGADESKLKGFGLPVMGENKPQPKADIPIPPKVKSGEQQVNVPAQDLLAQNIQDFGNRLTGEHLNKNIAEGTVKVKANPQDDKGLYQLAYGYLESGNDATAKKIFEDVLLANPENADAIEGLAHIASKNNDAKTALELNEQAFAKAPTIQRINNIAQLKLQSGDVEGAKQASDYAIENAPDDYRALQIKSLVEKKLGNNTESSEYLTKAIEKYQENIKAPLLSQQEQDYKGKIDTRTEAEQWQSSIDNLGNIAGEFIGNAMNLPQYAGQNVEGIVNGLTEMKHGMERMNPFNEESNARDRFIGFLQTLQGASEASFGGLMMTPHGYVFTQGINAADVITNGEAGKILMAPLQSYLPVQNEIGQRLEGLGDVLISLIAFGAMHKGLSSKGVDVQKVTDAYGKYKRGESLTGEDIKVLSSLVDKNTNPETLKKLRQVSESFPKGEKPDPEMVAYLASLDSEVFGSMDVLTPYQKVIVAPLLEQRNAEIKKKEAAAPPLKKIHDEKIKAIDEKINEAITKDQVDAAKKEVDDHIKQLALQQRDQLGLPLADPAIEKGESLIHTDIPKELSKEEKLKQSQKESGGVTSDIPIEKIDTSIKVSSEPNAELVTDVKSESIELPIKEDKAIKEELSSQPKDVVLSEKDLQDNGVSFIQGSSHLAKEKGISNDAANLQHIEAGNEIMSIVNDGLSKGKSGKEIISETDKIFNEKLKNIPSNTRNVIGQIIKQKTSDLPSVLEKVNAIDDEIASLREEDGSIKKKEDIEKFKKLRDQKEKLLDDSGVNNKQHLQEVIKEQSTSQPKTTPKESIKEEVVEPTSLEQKRIEIERRRDEELNENASKIEDKAELFKDEDDHYFIVAFQKDGSKRVIISDENGKRYGVIGTYKGEVSNDKFINNPTKVEKDVGLKSDRLTEKINKKYDAEIKALEESQPKTTPKESIKEEVVPESQTTDTRQQLEEFGVPKEDVEATHGLLNQVFSGLKKAGLTAAKTVGDWVGIGKGSEKPYSLKIGDKEVQVKNTQPEVVNGFYSPLEKVITESKFDKLPAKQWAEKYANSEEAKWTGLKDWLAQQQGSVSKADIQQFLKDNRIQVIEVVKGEVSNFTKDDIADVKINQHGAGNWVVKTKEDGTVEFPLDKADDKAEAVEYALEQLNYDNKSKRESKPKFQSYQTEGEKSNYKEVLVTMPDKKQLTYNGWFNKWDGLLKELYEKYNVNRVNPAKDLNEKISATDKKRFDDLKAQEPSKEKTEFSSSHFDEPNILVHLRMNTRVDAEGKKVLFLEEVQSDWGQKGKKEGFDSEKNDYKAIADRFAKGLGFTQGSEADVKLALKRIKQKSNIWEREYAAFKEAGFSDAEINKMAADYTDGLTPSAPFVTDTNSWTKLGLKVALKEAVKQGADKIAWTTGEQQNDRYDLSKQVDKIDVEAVEDVDGLFFVDIKLSNGNIENLEVENGIIREGNYKGQRLDNVIGKDYADKILSTPKGESKTLEGADLKVGGKGMKGFYGSPKEGSLGIVGNVAKSLFKQVPKTVDIFQSDKLASGWSVTVKDKQGYVSTQMFDSKSKGLAWLSEQEGLEVLSSDAEGKNYSTQHSIDITPELKASVEGGQPLFKDAEAQYRIESGKNIVEAIKDFNGSPRATVALTHEIMHPTVVSIIDGARDGNEVGKKHTQTIVDEYNKATKSNVTAEQLIKDNDAFKEGKTTDRYRDVQEFIAESWEKYHREGGKGFSEAFQKVLDQITEAFKAVYKSISGKELTPELRQMFDEILGKEKSSINEKSQEVKHESKESSSKTTIKEGEVVGGNVELSKEEKAAGFVKLPIAKVKKALKDFQGRTAEYSKTTYDSIVGEAKDGTLNISSIPAIQIWGETGELLAGHSRVKAFEDLASGKLPLNEKYKPSDFENINAQIVEAKTREEAKRIAERSNSGAQQTPFENSKILARMRREGATKGAIDKEASRLAQHGDKKHTINLSNLSEDGKASLTLAAAEKTPEKIGKERTEAIRLAADKAGEMRGEFPELTKLHEDEIFDALINGKVKASEVEARVNRVVNSAAEPFNPSNKLNIESVAHISPEEMIFQQRTADLRKEIKDLQRSIKRDAETKLTPIEQDYLERAIALNNGSESLGRKEFESEKTKNLITKKTDEAKALLKRRQEDLQNHLISKKNLSGAPSLFDVVNTEIKNKTITNEQANRFIEATEDVAKDEAVITNLESKEKGATEVSELKEVVKAADELIEKSKEEPPKTYTEKAKRVADKIRSFKSKPLDLRDENGNKIVIEKKGFDDNDLIEGIAKLVEQGGRLADAIKSELEKHKWYNDLTDKGKDAVYKQLEESFSKEGSGITHELTDETRKEFGLGEPYEGRETVHDIDLNNRAEAAIKEGYNIDRLVSRLRDGSFPDELETVILKKYKATLEAEIEKNPTPEKLQELKDFVKATDIVGTLQGAAFRQRQGIEIRDDSLAGYFAREMDNNGGAELTEAQKIKVQEEYKKIKEAQAAYDEKISKLEEENAKLKAQSELNKVKNTTAKKPKKAHDDFVAERKDILNSISEKLKASRGQANDIVRATIDFTKIAPDVAKLMKSYVEEGYSKLEDIVKKIHNDLKPHIDGITEKDVHDIIAGEYKEKKATKSELAAKLVDLKEQARLSNKLDALLRGEEPKNEKAKIKRNKEIEDLRNKIKEFRKEKAEAESVQKKLDEQKQKASSKLTPEQQALKNLKKKYANQILQLENDLRTNNFLQPEKKVPLKMDKEAIALQDELIKLKRERETRLARQAYQNRTRQQKFMDTLKEVLNIPRTIISSMDFSAPLRQGVIPSISHPTVAMRAAKEMFKMAVSEKRFDRWFDDVKKTPRWRLMEESGLYVADPHDPRLSVKEEAFMNNLAEKIPIAGKLIKGSERAYVGYLNKMRVDLFNRFADVLEVQGKTWENSPELYKALGDYINNSTGRGKINAIEQAAPLLNGLLFSPRLIASRLNLLNPFYYKSLPKEVRIEAMKDMGKFLGVGMAVLALASLNGAEVETDPRSSDFGKIQVGKTRYDIWGGFQQYIRVLAQFVSGQAKSTASDQIREINGEGKFGESRASVVGRFVRGKASPILSSVINLAAGTDMMGNKSTLQSEALRFVTPLIFSDLNAAMKDKGISSLFTVGVPATFGVGVSTYLPKGYDTKDLEDNTLKFLYDKNLNLSIPTQQELTDKEYQEFQPIQKKYLKEEWKNIIEHGALFNEEGNPTIDEDAAVTIKPIDRLTYDDLTKLMKSASNRATRKAKKEVVKQDESDTNEAPIEIEEIGN